MRKCNNCGRLYSDMVNTCSNCGSPLTGGSQNRNTASTQPAVSTPPIQTVSAPQPATSPAPQPAPQPVQQPAAQPTPLSTPAVASRDGNMGKGILGAALYATGGAALAAILLNVGYVAALSGILTMFLAVLGYKKFSECSEDYSIKVTLLCIAISFVMLYLGHYVGYLVLCKNVLADDGYMLTLAEAAQLVAEIPELREELFANFAMSAVFWGISGVVSLFRRRK